jgi:hypothetical protein
MAKYLTFLKKIIATFVLVSFLSGNFAFAQQGQSAPRPSAGNSTASTVNVNQGSQGNVYAGGSGNKNSSNNALGGAAGDAAGCAVGSLLGSYITSSITASISGTNVPTDDTKNNQKEGAWDAVAFCLANAAIHYIAQSTINWINSGFEGNPVFVDNPGQFFQDIADTEASAFIDELGLGFLCSNFAPQVRIAIANNWAKKTDKTGGVYRKQAQCTFDGIEKNLDSFLQDFRNGGLDSFVDFSFNPANNPAGAYLLAQDELNRRVSLKQDGAKFELRFTDFLSIKECPEKIVNGKTVKDTANCVTKSPGQVIQAQLEDTLNLPKDRLAMADEINEVITALVNQLIKSALSENVSPSKNRSVDDDEDDDRFDMTNEDITEDIYVNNNNNTPTSPAPVSKLKLACETNLTTVAVDEPVEFKAIASGGRGNYKYSWYGGTDFPTSTEFSSINVFFPETGTSSVSVQVKSGSQKKRVDCPVVEISAPTPLEVSCAVDDTSVDVGETVVWKAQVSGGTGFYTYLWSGNDEVDGATEQDVIVSYDDDGTYRSELKVTSGSQSKTVSCENRVRVR